MGLIQDLIDETKAKSVSPENTLRQIGVRLERLLNDAQVPTNTFVLTYYSNGRLRYRTFPTPHDALTFLRIGANTGELSYLGATLFNSQGARLLNDDEIAGYMDDWPFEDTWETRQTFREKLSPQKLKELDDDA